MRFSLLSILTLAFAASVSCAQEPAKPAAKPDAAAEIKVVSAPYHAAVETVSAEYQKWITSLETWYLAELDKLQAARAKLGDLDGAIATKKERERMASHSPTTPEQIQAMPAPLRTLRTGYDQGLKKSADEGARRMDVARRKYLADLEALQKRITTTGDIDQALLVKAEKDRFIAEMAGDAQGTAAVGPAKVAADPIVTTTPKPAVTEVPFGTKPGQALAKLEVQDVVTLPLTVGGIVWGNKPDPFTEIPAAFEGFQFTQGKMGSATLKFKVLTDGLVHMACTSRFGGGGNSGGGWKSEVTSEEQLEKNGWKRERGIELKDAQKDHVWWTFTRTCKSGEEFTFRTEKYISPMLLMK